MILLAYLFVGFAIGYLHVAFGAGPRLQGQNYFVWLWPGWLGLLVWALWTIMWFPALIMLCGVAVYHHLQGEGL